MNKKYWYIIKKPGVIFGKYEWLVQKPEWIKNWLFKKLEGNGSLPIRCNCKESDHNHFMSSHLKCFHHNLLPCRLCRYVYHRIISKSKSSTTRHPNTLYLFAEDKVTSARTALPPSNRLTATLEIPTSLQWSKKQACYFLAWSNVVCIILITSALQCSPKHLNQHHNASPK